MGKLQVQTTYLQKPPILKADMETATNIIIQPEVFSKIWEKNEVPAQWKEGIVTKLPKKVGLRDCNNY
jgi:hypothetical protein